MCKINNKANGLMQSIKNKNCYSPLETEENPTENGNRRTNSPNTKATAKQYAINAATQNVQNPNDKTESDTPDKRKLPFIITLVDSMAKDIKDWKKSSLLTKLW